MPSHTLSNIEASTGVHVLCYPCSTEGMTTYSFLESTGACSGLHELPNARAVHMAQLRYFLVFSKRWEKGSRRIRSKIGGKKPLVDGLPGLRVDWHLVNFAALFVKPQPTLPFPLEVIFDIQSLVCSRPRRSEAAS